MSKKTKFNCNFCGKSNERYVQKKTGDHYCSRHCYNEQQRKYIQQINDENEAYLAKMAKRTLDEQIDDEMECIRENIEESLAMMNASIKSNPDNNTMKIVREKVIKRLKLEGLIT